MTGTAGRAEKITPQGALTLKLTPSRVRDYISCPRRYEQKYLRNAESGSASMLSPQESAARSFANTLHCVLEALHQATPGEHTGPPPGREMLEAQIDDLLSLHWQSAGYTDRDTEEAAFLEARSILTYYVKSPYIPTPTGSLLGSELYLNCHTTLAGRRVELSARFDRCELLLPGGVLECLDYKTNRDGQVPSATSLTSDLPSFLYFILAWHRWRSDPRVNSVVISQLNLLSLCKTRVEYSQRQIVTNKAALIELVAAIAAEEFEPRTNRSCAWCPVQESCPAWAELNLEDLEGFDAWKTRYLNGLYGDASGGGKDS